MALLRHMPPAAVTRKRIIWCSTPPQSLGGGPRCSLDSVLNTITVAEPSQLPVLVGRSYVTLVPQKSDKGCLPAAVQTLLTWYGIMWDDATASDRLGTTEDGSAVWRCVNALHLEPRLGGYQCVWMALSHDGKIPTILEQGRESLKSAEPRPKLKLRAALTELRELLNGSDRHPVLAIVAGRHAVVVVGVDTAVPRSGDVAYLDPRQPRLVTKPVSSFRKIWSDGVALWLRPTNH